MEQRQSCKGLGGTGTSVMEEVMRHKRLGDRKSKCVLHISYFWLSAAGYMFRGESNDEYKHLTARTAAMGIAAFMKTAYGERKQFLLHPTPTTSTWSDLSSTNVELHNLLNHQYNQSSKGSILFKICFTNVLRQCASLSCQ